MLLLVGLALTVSVVAAGCGRTKAHQAGAAGRDRTMAQLERIVRSRVDSGRRAQGDTRLGGRASTRADPDRGGIARMADDARRAVGRRSVLVCAASCLTATAHRI
jgi:hypothetical protein